MDELKAILEAMEDAVFIVNDRYQIEYCNPIIFKEFGPLAGQTCYEYFHDRDDVCPWCKNQEVFQGKTVRWEWTSPKTGKTFDLFDAPLKKQDGTVVKLEIMHDVTARKQTEEALRVAEEEYRGIVENALEGMFQTSVDGRYLMANPALAEMLGYDSPQHLLTAITDIPLQIYVDPDDRTRLKSRLDEEGHIREFVTRFRRRDGDPIWVRLSIRQVKDAGGKVLHYEGMCENITERKQAELDLRQSETRLAQLSFQLMSAQETERSRIAREIHDELGQALAVLKCRVGLIENKLEPHQNLLREDCREILHYLDQVIEETRRLSKDLSPSIVEDLGLEPALHWLFKNFNKCNAIQLMLHMSPLEHRFSSQTAMFIYRIFQEGLTNIARHAQAGRVTVRIEKGEGQVHFLLEDDGRGFDPEETQSRVEPGRGLGLSTIRQRIRMLGGRLDLWSRPGQGTRLAFVIPLQKGGDRL